MGLDNKGEIVNEKALKEITNELEHLKGLSERDELPEGYSIGLPIVIEDCLMLISDLMELGGIKHLFQDTLATINKIKIMVEEGKIDKGRYKEVMAKL